MLALALAACGGGLPGNSVVKVDNQTIKRSTFDHWVQIAAVSAAGQQNPSATTPPKVTVPDAPAFAKCIANKKKTAAKPAKGQPEPTDAQFKQQCQSEYEGLKNQVLSFLIRSTWLDNEAKSMKINVADLGLLREELEDRFGPLPEPVENLISLQQARVKLGQAGARAVSFRAGRLAVTPIDLDAARAARVKEQIPGSTYEPGRSQLSVRVPDDPQERFPAVIHDANALLAVTREAA